MKLKEFKETLEKKWELHRLMHTCSPLEKKAIKPCYIVLEKKLRSEPDYDNLMDQYISIYGRAG